MLIICISANHGYIESLHNFKLQLYFSSDFNFQWYCFAYGLVRFRSKNLLLHQGQDLYFLWLKIPARNTGGNILTSREKYAELLPQTWQETSQCLVKNTLFCRHKHSWKCPDLPSKIQIFVSTNMVRNIPKTLAEALFLSSRTSTKMSHCHCPKALLKTLSVLAANMPGNVPTSH